MSHVTVKMVGDEEFLAALKKASHETYKEVHDEAVKIANDVRNNIITGMKKTPKNTAAGLARRFTTNKATGKRKSIKTGKRAKFHFPSFPGNYPAIDSGELVGSIATNVKDSEIEVGSVGVPHAIFTDKGTKGTKRMAARPWLEPSYKNIPIEDRIRAAFKRGSGI